PQRMPPVSWPPNRRYSSRLLRARRGSGRRRPRGAGPPRLAVRRSRRSEARTVYRPAPPVLVRARRHGHRRDAGRIVRAGAAGAALGARHGPGMVVSFFAATQPLPAPARAAPLRRAGALGRGAKEFAIMA